MTELLWFKLCFSPTFELFLLLSLRLFLLEDGVEKAELSSPSEDILPSVEDVVVGIAATASDI